MTLIALLSAVPRKGSFAAKQILSGSAYSPTIVADAIGESNKHSATLRHNMTTGPARRTTAYAICLSS
eukprot:6282752-Amphidinium_carterae.1